MGVLGFSYKVVWELGSGHAEIVCFKGCFNFVLCERPWSSPCAPMMLVHVGKRYSQILSSGAIYLSEYRAIIYWRGGGL